MAKEVTFYAPESRYRTMMPDGRRIDFSGGKFTTSDKEIIDQLNSNPSVSTTPPPKPVTPLSQADYEGKIKTLEKQVEDLTSKLAEYEKEDNTK